MTATSRILVVDDEDEIRGLLSRLLQKEGFEALGAADGEAALGLIRRESPDVILLDLKMPGMDGMEVLRRTREFDPNLPVIIVTSHGQVQGAVDAMRAGAHDYLTKPFEHNDVLLSVRRALTERELRRTIRVLSDRALEARSLQDLMGPSKFVARISEDVARVARSNFAVMITGETGTGKELVARAIHQSSPRATAPFVAVDCGAIPESLFESELFGHEKGSFTGAERQKAGKFEFAQGGSLFLDEIGNMPLGCQAKLLRGLQDKSVTRVGGTKPVDVDVRFLAAMNQNLEAAISAGSFRRDLFFRLNEFAITIPPIRQRKEDIVFLAKRFLDLTNHELRKNVRGFTDSSIERLLNHSWPGNARELRSTVRRAVLLADDVITDAHLCLPVIPDLLVSFPISPGAAGFGLPLRELVRRSTIVVERTALVRALGNAGGNKAKAARLLQIDYKTIHTKLKEYGINGRGHCNGRAEEQGQDARLGEQGKGQGEAA